MKIKKKLFVTLVAAFMVLPQSQMMAVGGSVCVSSLLKIREIEVGLDARVDRLKNSFLLARLPAQRGCQHKEDQSLIWVLQADKKSSRRLVPQ